MTNDDEAPKAIDELNGATVQGANQLTSLEPSQKEKEELTTVVVEIHAVVMVVEIVVEKTVVVETEEDINIPFNYYKKRCQCNTPFYLVYFQEILTMKRSKEGLFSTLI
jgi:hypothetical protein